MNRELCSAYRIDIFAEAVVDMPSRKAVVPPAQPTFRNTFIASRYIVRYLVGMSSFGSPKPLSGGG